MRQTKYLPMEAEKAIKELFPDSEAVFSKVAEIMISKANRCICEAPVGVYYARIAGTYQYKCRRCRRVVSPLSVTPLSREHKKLTDTLDLACRYYYSKKDISPTEISALYKCKYETSKRKSGRVIRWMKLALAHSGNAPPENHRKVIKTFSARYDNVTAALNGLFNSLPSLLEAMKNSKTNNNNK